MLRKDGGQDALTEHPGSLTVRNSMYAFMDRGIYALLGVVYILYFARKLPTEEFGLFILADALRIFAMTFCDTTVGQALVYFGAGKTRKILGDIVVNSSALKAVLFLVSSAIVLVLAPFARLVFDHEGAPALFMTVPVLVLAAMLVNTPSQVLNAEEDYRRLFLYNASQLLLFLAGIAWAEASNFLTDAYRAVVFISLTRAVSSIAGHWMIRTFLTQIPLRLRTDTIKTLFSYSRASFMNSLGVFLFTKTDVFLVGIILTPQYVATYAAVAVFINFFRLLSEPFSLMLLPAVAKVYHERFEVFQQQVSSLYKKTSRAAFLISLPFSLAMFFFPDRIMLFLYGNRYTDSATLVRLFALWGITVPFYRTAATIFNGIGKPELNARFTWIGAAVNALLNIPLIYALKAEGSALASVATTIVLLGLYAFALLKLFTAPYVYGRITPERGSNKRPQSVESERL